MTGADLFHAVCLILALQAVQLVVTVALHWRRRP